MLAATLSVPFIANVLIEAFTSKVIMCPAAIATSLVAVGTMPQAQVEGEDQLPVCTVVNDAEPPTL